jgi:hypothetical protein
MAAVCLDTPGLCLLVPAPHPDQWFYMQVRSQPAIQPASQPGLGWDSRQIRLRLSFGPNNLTAFLQEVLRGDRELRYSRLPS